MNHTRAVNHSLLDLAKPWAAYAVIINRRGRIFHPLSSETNLTLYNNSEVSSMTFADDDKGGSGLIIGPITQAPAPNPKQPACTVLWLWRGLVPGVWNRDDLGTSYLWTRNVTASERLAVAAAPIGVSPDDLTGYMAGRPGSVVFLPNTTSIWVSYPFDVQVVTEFWHHHDFKLSTLSPQVAWVSPDASRSSRLPRPGRFKL